MKIHEFIGYNHIFKITELHCADDNSECTAMRFVAHDGCGRFILLSVYGNKYETHTTFQLLGFLNDFEHLDQYLHEYPNLISYTKYKDGKEDLLSLDEFRNLIHDRFGYYDELENDVDHKYIYDKNALVTILMDANLFTNGYIQNIASLELILDGLI